MPSKIVFIFYPHNKIGAKIVPQPHSPTFTTTHWFRHCNRWYYNVFWKQIVTWIGNRRRVLERERRREEEIFWDEWVFIYSLVLVVGMYSLYAISSTTLNPAILFLRRLWIDDCSYFFRRKSLGWGCTRNRYRYICFLDLILLMRLFPIIDVGALRWNVNMCVSVFGFQFLSMAWFWLLFINLGIS